MTTKQPIGDDVKPIATGQLIPQGWKDLGNGYMSKELSQETIDRLQGNYKPGLHREYLPEGYQPVRHIQTSQKVTTDTARVQLDLPKDGVVILTPAEYLKLHSKEYELTVEQKKATKLQEKIVNLLRNLLIEGVDIRGAEYLFNSEKELERIYVTIPQQLTTALRQPKVGISILSK